MIRKNLTTPGAAAAMLAGLTLLVFAPTIAYDFVDWDDPVFILNNPLIRGLSFPHLADMFTSWVSGNYIPMTLVSFAVNHALSGLEPWSYHAVNVLLHTANGVLVFTFIRRLTGSVSMAWITAACFALHPLRVESVAWVTERKDLLFALFYLGSVLTFLAYRDQPSSRRWAAAFVLFLLSGLSKQQAVSLPLILLLCDLFQGRRWTLANLLPLLPFVAAAAGFAAIAVLGQQTADSLKVGPLYSPAHRLLLASHSLGFYIVKQGWPHPLSAIYEYPADVIAHSAFSPIRTLLFVAVFIALSRNHRAAQFAGAFFFITLLPMLNLFPAGTQVVADRFTYLPGIGFGLFVASLGHALDHRLRDSRCGRIALRATGIILLALLMTLTVQRNRVWATSHALWTATLEVMPESYTAMLNLAVWHLNHDEPEDALTLSERIVRLYPGLMDGYMVRGLAHYAREDHARAVADFSRAIALQPDLGMLHFYRGRAYLALDRPSEALQDFNQATRLDPDQPERWHELGTLHATRKDWEPAIHAFTQALRLVPGQPDALFNRGRAYALSGQTEAGLRDMNAILIDHPDHLPARYQRMLLYLDQGNLPGARNDARYLTRRNVAIPEDLQTRLNAPRP